MVHKDIRKLNCYKKYLRIVCNVAQCKIIVVTECLTKPANLIGLAQIWKYVRLNLSALNTKHVHIKLHSALCIYVKIHVISIHLARQE